MTTHKGFAGITILLAVLGVLVLGGGAYVAMNPEVLKAPTEAEDDGVQTEPGDHMEVDHEADEGDAARKGSDKWIEIDSAQMGTAKTSISWKLTTLGERENIPYTKVTVVLNGKTYDVGEFQGSCSEIGASGGVDGKGLLAGELSAVQCWFAGGGDEIGVFAHEDGGYQIMAGSISEPDGEGSTGFRGDFKIKTDISL